MSVQVLVVVTTTMMVVSWCGVTPCWASSLRSRRDSDTLDTLSANVQQENTKVSSGDRGLPPDDLNIGTPGDFEENPDLFEGDILLTRSQQEKTLQATRKGIVAEYNLWPRMDGHPTMHYRIGNTEVRESTIKQALAHYEEHTCLRFKDTWFFHIGNRVNFDKGSGCSSMLGRQIFNIFGGQQIQLAAGCDSTKVVVHEIGHALGLYHEQSRSDRDTHIRVLTVNIRSDRLNNFNRQWLTKNFETVYDYYSVMQYGPLAFTKEGKTTLAAEYPLAQGLMVAPRTGLSFMDKLLVNRLYKCIDDWEATCGRSPGSCHNLGYVGPDCACVCPPGTTGDNCGTKTMDYIEALISELLPLTGSVTSAGEVATPGYPSPPEETVIFSKLYTAPSNCQRVVLTVSGFDLYDRYSRDGRCLREGVEIKLGDQVTSGTWYCDKELSAGDVLKSEGNTLVLFYLRSSVVSSSYDGFKFDISFEENPNC